MGYCGCGTLYGGEVMGDHDAADGFQFYYSHPMLDDAVYAGTLDALLAQAQIALMAALADQMQQVAALTVDDIQ